MRIEPAQPHHARKIAEGIVMAITPELVAESMAPMGLNAEQGTELFASMAARTDTQYSYLNTLVALDDDDNIMGLLVGYDGARLEELRRPFLDAVLQQTGYDLAPNLPDETEPGEYYLDTLAVWPEYRRQGKGAALLRAATERAHAIGKPAGLLVDKANANARRLYESIGFKMVGERYFFDEMMDHLQK